MIKDQVFETDLINNITITDDRVLVDYKSDFIVIHYEHANEIRDAQSWIKAKSISQEQLKDAIAVLALVCDNHINTYNQCADCPLFRGRCLLTVLPIDWSEDDNKIIEGK